MHPNDSFFSSFLRYIHTCLLSSLTRLYHEASSFKVQGKRYKAPIQWFNAPLSKKSPPPVPPPHQTMSPPSPTPSPITASLLASHTLPQLKFLYSSLSPRALSNPTGYRSAINSWREILTDLVGKGLLGGGGRLGVEVGEAIVEELRVDGVGRPGGLGGVLVSGFLGG